MSTAIDIAVRAAEALVANHSGLRATAATEPRLVSSLRARASACGVDLDNYVATLARDPEERQALLELLTVQETSFFRDGAQFDALIRQIVPRTTGPVVIWSAGCATGQEPYSIAMALDEAGVRDWWVVATDVSRQAIERTRLGFYRPSELRGLSPARAGRYLQRVDDGFRIVPELRERITTYHHNLATDEQIVGRASCNAVFCRNVFIYLRRDRVSAALGRIHDSLATKGVLLLGGSETLGRDDARFRLTRFGDAFGYERVDAQKVAPFFDAASAPAAPARPGPVRSPRPVALPTGEELRHDGESASRVGDHTEAAICFRKAIYLDKDDLAAHLGLAFSLEAQGHHDASQRAFKAAQVALARVDADHLGPMLEGYAADTIRVVLAAKLRGVD